MQAGGAGNQLAGWQGSAIAGKGNVQAAGTLRDPGHAFVWRRRFRVSSSSSTSAATSAATAAAAGLLRALLLDCKADGAVGLYDYDGRRRSGARRGHLAPLAAVPGASGSTGARAAACKKGGTWNVRQVQCNPCIHGAPECAEGWHHSVARQPEGPPFVAGSGSPVLPPPPPSSSLSAAAPPAAPNPRRERWL